MLFPTVDFAVFFALVFLGHWLLNPKPLPWKLFMIGASYVFYAWWDVAFRAGCWPASPRSRRWAPGGRAPGAGTRAALDDGRRGGAHPAAPRCTSSTTGSSRSTSRTPSTRSASTWGCPLVQLILPVGDLVLLVHGGEPTSSTSTGATFEPASWIDLFLYLSFFPHLVAGPIVRPDELIPQLDVRRDPRHVDVAGASWLIFGGLFKKVVISSYLATHDRGSGVRRPGAATARSTSLFAIVALRDRDLRRLQRVHRHRDRHREAARVPVPAELRPALQRAIAAGLLAPMAHHVVALAPRLPLHPARRFAEGRGPDVRQHARDDGAGRAVARRRVDLRLLGRLPRRRARRSARGSGRISPTPARRRCCCWVNGSSTFNLVCVGWVFFRSDSVATAFSMLGTPGHGLGTGPGRW